MTLLHRCLVSLALSVLPSAVLAQYAYTTGTVNMRAGPDSSYPLVLRVYPGTQVQVHGCIADWSWCDVSVGFERGWIYAPYLAYPYQGNNVTIYGFGPSLGVPIISFTIGPYWDNYYRGRPWWYQRNDWYYRPPPVHRPPPPGWRPPPPSPPPGWRPPPGQRPPPGGRPPPPMPKPKPVPKPPTSAPPGPAPMPR